MDALAFNPSSFYRRNVAGIGRRLSDVGQYCYSVPVNWATKLMNQGYEVDFALPWNRGHEGDYHLNDLFEWVRTITD